MPRRVISIGHWEAPEFKSAADWLQRHVDLHRVPSIEAGIEQLSDGHAVDIILVAPSHRSEFQQDDIRRLQAACPLSHLYVVVGSWCEGETRSGHAWPAIERLYVHQLIPRARSDGWDREFFAASITPGTASTDERWMARATRLRTRDAGLVLICGRESESRSALSELCRWAGFQTISMKSPRGSSGNPMAVIYDAHRNLQQRRRDLHRLATAFPNARMLTLIEHPRHDEVQQALDAGSDDVLGKPYDIDDLLACLRQETPALD
jgi:CheY-like chemotaxis protein